MPVQGASGYSGAYQVIVYGASPYLLRQIKFLEPNASMQTYQGRQVILAGAFDSPAAAQQRMLTLSDRGVGAQVISTNTGSLGQPFAGTSYSSMPGGMATPAGNGMNPSLMVPDMDTPPNLYPNATPTAPSTFAPAPTAITPTAMPMNALPGGYATAPTTVAQAGWPNALPDASVNAPIPIAPAGTPGNSLYNAPMDGSVVTPPPSMMNPLPPNNPMTAPMGSPPLGTATVTPPTTAIPGNFNSGARYEVVIPARMEDFNGIANRLTSMGVRPDAIQGREKPRGPHISVGPYMQAREAEAMSQVLRANGIDARVFYVR